MSLATLTSFTRTLRPATAGGAAALRAYRDARVRALVRHAAERVPWYRESFARHGIDPRSIRGVDDLPALPASSRADLQACGDADRLAHGTDPDTLILRSTTGSTGRPLRIRRTWTEERLLGTFRWRALRSLGARWSDRYAEIEERVPRDPNDGRALHTVAERLGLLRQLRVDALAPPEATLALLRDFRPDVLSGYAGVVARLADVASERDLALPAPRLVVVHSDTLTARMRRAIGDALGAPVFEIYDSHEFNVIASQCPQTGALHVCDDSVVVEVMVDGRAARPGERGEAIVTALHSRAMPFVRYRIGDLVVRGADRCACGAPCSTLHAVEGRMFDHFPLADGRVVHPFEIVAILDRTAPWLLRYRLTQERRDHVTLEVVPHEWPSAAAVDGVRVAIAGFLGPATTIRVELVADLPPDGHAKTRICRSLVASEYGTG